MSTRRRTSMIPVPSGIKTRAAKFESENVDFDSDAAQPLRRSRRLSTAPSALTPLMELSDNVIARPSRGSKKASEEPAKIDLSSKIPKPKRLSVGREEIVTEDVTVAPAVEVEVEVEVEGVSAVQSVAIESADVMEPGFAAAATPKSKKNVEFAMPSTPNQLDVEGDVSFAEPCVTPGNAFFMPSPTASPSVSPSLSPSHMACQTPERGAGVTFLPFASPANKSQLQSGSPVHSSRAPPNTPADFLRHRPSASASPSSSSVPRASRLSYTPFRAALDRRVVSIHFDDDDFEPLDRDDHEHQNENENEVQKQQIEAAESESTVVTEPSNVDHSPVHDLLIFLSVLLLSVAVFCAVQWSDAWMPLVSAYTGPYIAQISALASSYYLELAPHVSAASVQLSQYAASLWLHVFPYASALSTHLTELLAQYASLARFLIDHAAPIVQHYVDQAAQIVSQLVEA